MEACKKVRTRFHFEEIKQSVLFPNPVTSNIEGVPSFDDFRKELLHDKSKTADMQIKNKLKLQAKTGSTYGPLPRMGQCLKPICTAKDETVDAYMGMLLNCTQQTFVIRVSHEFCDIS